MRLLAMVHLWPPDHCAGAELMLESMLRPFVQRGHEVNVLLSRETRHDGPYERHGLTIWPRIDKNDPWSYLPQSDVAITHLENTPRTVILSRMTHKPFVLVCHNTFEVTHSWLVEDAGLVVFNSRSMREKLGGHPNELIIHPPVFADEYRTTPGDLVTLINLNEDKGALVFYELAERMPDVNFLGVVGAHGPQIVRTDLPNVEVVKHVPGERMREQVYGRTRVLLMPSKYESWGRCGVEAAASGIPTIAAPTPGLRESLAEAGTFVELDDLDAWEAELRNLLDGRRWNAASRKALARSAELDPTAELDEWCERVEKLARARNGPALSPGDHEPVRS